MKFQDIENMTNGEAVAYYGPLTNSYVPCSDLENLLDWAGVAKRNSVSGEWEGSIIDFMLSPPAGAEALAAGLAELFSHLNKPHSVGADTHMQPWAGKMSALLGGLVAVGQINQSFADDVVALAGGFVYPTLDEAEVQAIRDAETDRLAVAAQLAAEAAAREADIANRKANRDLYDARYNEHVASVMFDPQSTEADIKLAVEALAASYGA